MTMTALQAQMTMQQPVNSLKAGSYVCLKGSASKITDIVVSRPGKHWPAKACIFAADVFTGKKHELVAPVDQCIEVPCVLTGHHQLIDLDERTGALCLMDEHDNAVRDDLCLPMTDANNNSNSSRHVSLQYLQLAEEICAAFSEGHSLQLAVLAAMGKERVMSFKELKTK